MHKLRSKVKMLKEFDEKINEARKDLARFCRRTVRDLMLSTYRGTTHLNGDLIPPDRDMDPSYVDKYFGCTLILKEGRYLLTGTDGKIISEEEIPFEKYDIPSLRNVAQTLENIVGSMETTDFTYHETE